MIVRFILLFILSIRLSYAQDVRIGSIEFFGTTGIDVQRVRSVLPVHEEDALPEEQMPEVRNRLVKAIENAIGHAPTDISLVCCNARQDLMVKRRSATLQFASTGGWDIRALVEHQDMAV